MEDQIQGQATCRVCNAPLFWTGRGKRPVVCRVHAKNKPRHDPGATLFPVPATPSEQTKKRASRQLAEDRAQATINDFADLRMAVGLGMAGDGDLEKAARIGRVRIDGRPPTEAELIELARLAKAEDLRAARECHSTFSANLYSRFLAINAITMLEEEPLLPSSGESPCRSDDPAGPRRTLRIEARLQQRHGPLRLASR